MIFSARKCAVMFADISGSTALYEHLGDELARRLVAQCLDVVCGELPAQRGMLIKTLGDEVMCIFSTAEQALLAARAMQQAVTQAYFEGGQKMALRIGFHFGEVIHESGDVFGDTVNVAARIAAIARAGEIMTSLEVVGHLPYELRLGVRQTLRAGVKGKQDRLNIFLVMWEADDGMSTRIGLPAYRSVPKVKNDLVLRYRNRQIVLSKMQRMIALGRDASCEIAVVSDFASRRHACVELRFDKFVIMDQSTNGTYVRPRNGEPCVLSREEMFLQGSGVISLGKLDFDVPETLIEYTLVTHERMPDETDTLNQTGSW